MASLKIMTCNVRGLSDTKKRKKLFNYLRNKKCDIVMLQETHSEKRSKIWRSEWGGDIIFSHGTSNARGTAILISKNVEYKVKKQYVDDQGRYVICHINIDEQNLLLANCYAPNNDDIEYWSVICDTLNKFSDIDLAVWGGDFNIHLTAKDKKGPYNVTKSVELLTDFMLQNEWMDVWRYLNPDESCFTYHRSKQKVWSRLDYFMVPTCNLDLIRECEIVPGFLSNHSFVSLDICFDKTIRGPGYWKFNNSFLRHTDFLKFINTSIPEQLLAINHLNDAMQWEILQNFLINVCKEYAKSKAAQRKSDLNEIERKIKSLNTKLHMINLSADNAITLIEKINRKLDYWKDKLNAHYEYKLQGQMLRAKSIWVEQGEKNTKYFLGLEKHKSKAKCMTKIAENDKTTTDPDRILELQHDFYAKLYKKDPEIEFNYVLNNPIQIDSTEKIILELELTLDEISTALKEMPNDKSPGSSGLTADFYKVFWGFLKAPLHKAYLHCKKEGQLYTMARQGILTLLPKKNRNRLYIKNWRPITLLNIDYKILSKAFANRIKLVLDDIINTDQKGFVKGRLISENIRQMFDLIQYSWQQNLPGIVVSVDFEKAFDRVDYKALKRILVFFGFGEIFISWVSLLFSNFNLYTTNNGYMSSPWTPIRGLFQGNPISSYLFLLVAEILAIKLRTNPKIEGIECNGIKYLLAQFADDLDLFLKYKQSVWMEVHWVPLTASSVTTSTRL